MPPPGLLTELFKRQTLQNDRWLYKMYLTRRENNLHPAQSGSIKKAQMIPYVSVA
jgi:hypothetical protein